MKPRQLAEVFSSHCPLTLTPGRLFPQWMSRFPLTFFLVRAALCVFLGLSASAQASVVADGATPQQVGTGYQIAEGPAADSAGDVYFTDCLASRILRWSDGKITTFKEKTGGSAGMRFGRDGFLYSCEFKNRRIARYALNGDMNVIVDKWEGKRFNTPNDLWVDAKGGVYFTDPLCIPVSPVEMDGENVFYIKPGHKEIIRVAENLAQPNGIIGTPDAKTLYVATGKVLERDSARSIEAFDIDNDGTLKNRRTFVKDGSDGMALDADGRLYLTGESSVRVYDTQGKLLETIRFPEFVTNLTFCGADRKKLFITTLHAAYTLDMAVAGPRTP